MGTASLITAGDLACRLLIIADLNGDVNQPCIGSNPTRGAKPFKDLQMNKPCQRRTL
jgi:hypothetical protein